MRKALIPAVFVFSGLIATSVWNRVKWPCESSPVEMASAIIGELLTCAADEWTATNGLKWILRKGDPVPDLAGPHRNFARTVEFAVVQSP